MVRSREAVIDRVPEKVQDLYERFRYCPGCGRIYWEGTHYARMKAVIDRLQAVESPEGGGE